MPEKKSLGTTWVLSDTGPAVRSCPWWELSAPAAGGSKGGGEGHPQFYEVRSCPWWELSAPAAGGSKRGGEGHPQFYDTRMILDDLFLSEEWVSSVARSDHFPSPRNFFL